MDPFPKGVMLQLQDVGRARYILSIVDKRNRCVLDHHEYKIEEPANYNKIKVCLEHYKKILADHGVY